MVDIAPPLAFGLDDDDGTDGGARREGEVGMLVAGVGCVWVEAAVDDLELLVLAGDLMPLDHASGSEASERWLLSNDVESSSVEIDVSFGPGLGIPLRSWCGVEMLDTRKRLPFLVA